MTLSNEERTLLARKLLCKCPICQKQIYGETLGLHQMDISQVKTFPFSYTYVHTHNQSMQIESFTPNFHALTLYFDANLTVRGIEGSKMTKIEEIN